MDNVQSLVNGLNEKLGGKVGLSDDMSSVIVPLDYVTTILKELKENSDFTFLADLTAVDLEKNFAVVYHLMSLKDATIVRLKVYLEKENPQIKSAVPLWKSADVMEREVYDLMGIIFEGHPNLKRILSPDDFTGYPLRKNFQWETTARQ